MSAIPIFLASDNNYAPFVATTIYSIVSNTNSFVDFYILDGGISLNNRQKIDYMKSQFQNFSIKYYDMSNFNIKRFPNIKHYSINTFSRYFISEIDKKLSKAIYLDVDIILKGDIASLYDQDIENYPMGAVLEDFYPDNFNYLKKVCPTYNGLNGYFNGGVLLLNLEYFRKNNLSDKLTNVTIELKDILSTPDQDVFNYIFDGNFKILDYKFNFMPDHFEMLKEKHPNIAKTIKDEAVILHYTAGKPWYNKSIASDDFWNIAKLTYFYDDIISKLNNYNMELKIDRELESIRHNLQYEINWIKFFGIFNNREYLKIVIFGMSFTIKMNSKRIDKIAFLIPIRKWRDNFRKKFL